MTGGSHTAALGTLSGSGVTTCNNCTFLGDNTGSALATMNHCIALGAYATCTAGSQLVISEGPVPAATATAGSATLPAAPVSFLPLTICPPGGVCADYKIALYNT